MISRNFIYGMYLIQMKYYENSNFNNSLLVRHKRILLNCTYLLIKHIYSLYSQFMTWDNFIEFP